MILALFTKNIIPNWNKIVLLSLLSGSIKQVKQDILHHFLTAAHTMIPHDWSSSQLPTLFMWVTKMEYISCKELHLAPELDKQKYYTQICATWTILHNSLEFINQVLPI